MIRMILAGIATWQAAFELKTAELEEKRKGFQETEFMRGYVAGIRDSRDGAVV